MGNSSSQRLGFLRNYYSVGDAENCGFYTRKIEGPSAPADSFSELLSRREQVIGLAKRSFSRRTKQCVKRVVANTLWIR